MFKISTMHQLYQFASLSAMQQLISARTINATLKVKPKDLTEHGNFKNRGIKKLIKIYGLSPEVAGQIYDCMIELSQHEDMESLNGLGGYEHPTIKMILSRYNLL